MINLKQLNSYTLHTQPFAWGEIDNLYAPHDAAALAASFPHDHFKTVAGYGGEKDYEYEARALIGMGAHSIAHAGHLSEEWLGLARDFLSADYRAAISRLSGQDLSSSPLEVNVFHYGPGANLGPHLDLPDKLVTHVLYFNQTWDRRDGGCLSILRSADPADLAAEIEPTVGNSAVLVRSEKSWHAVSRVAEHSRSSRRSLTATFYRPGSASSMWPAGDTTPLHAYDAPDTR